MGAAYLGAATLEAGDSGEGPAELKHRRGSVEVSVVTCVFPARLTQRRTTGRWRDRRPIWLCFSRITSSVCLCIIKVSMNPGSRRDSDSCCIWIVACPPRPSSRRLKTRGGAFTAGLQSQQVHISVPPIEITATGRYPRIWLFTHLPQLAAKKGTGAFFSVGSTVNTFNREPSQWQKN